ncbi:MAG: AAA family ATPase [Campylobacterales bacterium]|nr:AAA family ATPase [Campylobacterales bacterium]
MMNEKNYWLILCNPDEWFGTKSLENAQVNQLLGELEFEDWRVRESHFKDIKAGDLGIIKVGEDGRSKKRRTLANGHIVNKLEAGIYALFEIVEDDDKEIAFTAEDGTFRINLRVYENLFSQNRVINKDDSKDLLGGYYQQQSSVKMEKNIFDNVIEFLNKGNINMKKPRNQILYGPPGTGKTYNTITKALEIIDGTVPRERKEAKAKFEEYRKLGQIEFVTFHQSYGYEEFVEGIKPCDLSSCENTDHKEIKYAVQEGIFKKLCEEAKKSSFEESYELYIQNELANEKKVNLSSKSENKEFIISKSETGIGTDKKNTSFSYDKLIEIFNNPDQQRTNATYGQPIIEEILKKYPLKNYILIIDEINRGNISKIFGELITLIEPSKRIGADEAIKLKLPYSNKVFGVPQNLYIIGTMNTADRSIAQIDTALRRRFVFEEMLPKSELLLGANNQPLVIEEDGKKIEIQKILQAINERIEYIYDREHQIGHSYFMPLQKDNSKAKLDEIFRVNIIPLLAEYFYGDWHDIKIVLNDDDGYFISEKDELGFALMDTKRKKNKIFSVNSSFSVDGYVNIYKTK